MIFPPFRVDAVNKCLWRKETRVSLMPKPFAVLEYLVTHAGRLVTHNELLEAIWPDTYVQPEVLRRYILEIRRALDDNARTPSFVETISKRGYQFIAQVANERALRLSDTGVETRLIGRQSALAELDRHLQTAVRGQRQIVLVPGEAGIGKTSLVDAFQRTAANFPGILVARGQCLEGFASKEPYYPLFEAVRQLVQGPAGKLVLDTLRTHAPTWMIQFPALAGRLRQTALLQEVAGASRERMVRELCEALDVVTRNLGLVLTLEDLQRADRSTLDVLSAMARRREPVKLVILATFNPAGLMSDHPLRALTQDLLLHRLADELRIDRLQESEICAYLAAELAGHDFVPGLATVIFRHSLGNPLFMTAMVDHLVKQGVLCRADGRWIMTLPLEQVDPVPESLRHMLKLQLQQPTGADPTLRASEIRPQRAA